MRLGDLDALKKKFDDYIKANPNLSGVFELGKIIIDTTSTVVVDCKNCDGYEAGYSAGVRDTERPQCNQIAWEQGYKAGLAQGKHDIDHKANGITERMNADRMAGFVLNATSLSRGTISITKKILTL